MNKKILTITIGLVLTVCVLVTGFSLVVASSSNNNSRHYANIGTVNLSIAGRPNLGFGFFDKRPWSDLGVADVFDLFVSDPDTGALQLLGVVTDNQDYKDFYVSVFQFVFQEDNIIVVEPDQLNVWKKGTTIYAELTVPVTFTDFTGEDFALPPFSITLDSFDSPYRDELPLSPLPSGWSWTRKTRRGYNAVATFQCPDWGISGAVKPKFLAFTQFNSLDTFVPPSPP